MKSNRILPIVLVVLVIIFAAAAGYLYNSNSSEINRQKTLKNTINQKQVSYNSGLTQKAALEKTATDLASQLDSAKVLLANTHFRSSSESIEYDRTLYDIADSTNLRVTNIGASPPSSVKEQNNTYQVTTFNVTVEGLSPTGIFSKTAEDTAYIASVVDNILAFTNAVATSPDFDTAIIQPVNITEPKPMTDADIKAEIDGINTKIKAEIQDAIDAMTAQMQTDNVDSLTQAQIDTLVQTETAKMVADALAGKKPDEIKVLVEQANIARPSATITIDVWTYKGA